MFAQKEKERAREKDILKYTFIQRLCKIKQQNWSALPSTLAPLSPLNSPSHQVSTFLIGHRHDDSSLACCHLSSGQNADYYGIGIIWLPWAKMCLEESTESYSHYTHKIINSSTGQQSLIKTMNQCSTSTSCIIQQEITTHCDPSNLIKARGGKLF